jgi:16S rRNA (cytidine1402-2'-O)-methyltransferase
LFHTYRGKLKDITSQRALEVLNEKLISFLADDTTDILNSSLIIFKFTKPLSPYHQHNEHKSITAFGKFPSIGKGKQIALVTDAGTTPVFSESSFLSGKRMYKRWSGTLESLPDLRPFVPSPWLICGIPANRFCFEGFLPLKKGSQQFCIKLSSG